MQQISNALEKSLYYHAHQSPANLEQAQNDASSRFC